ncbi:lipid IV(A) 3-deoxy-D-manno-octulosonic acid transferase [Arenicella xantha]|uniref:3-deoxy-D-manno-octulosonic acid transferase n=1 Tax=Arenicella xantha TaxID=644221 RepID=A0A395JJQ3_9GAMM|nr:lipid IV(A) 3-deoxy-D-manno-octulosonic acid transferase [Arenicella xantha]RBP48904.1 3-deoxy-D-manno-octulosonic-acid transferase [Arenicella xantha]
MIWLYRLALNLAIPFGLIGLAVRGFKNSAYWSRWPERFGFANSEVLDGAPFDLWLHAVSVGEARAAAPLVKRLLQDQPDINILVTTTTPTGSAMVRMMLQDKVSHCYFPYDLAWAMRRFVRLVSARTVLIMETEIWPNMIGAVRRSGAKLIYTNVRLSERSYRGYARFSNWVAATLAQIDHFAVQGPLDRKHLELLGVPSDKISETGSIKFDINVPPSLFESAEVMRRQLGQDRLIWIAGSTREGEEGKVLAVYKRLKQSFPSLLLILVPRHPERFDYMARKVQRRGLVCVRRTDGPVELTSDVDVYLGDTMGELSLLYASSDVAFVGGSLEPLGGQNILEPCALGIPVVFGPHMFNFPDISRWTIKEGAGRMVQDELELEAVVAELLSNPTMRDDMGRRGRAFIAAHRGALEKNYQLIKSLT